MGDNNIVTGNEFSIWSPACVTIVKGASASGDRRIGGYCSTGDMDRQEEIVLQKGLNFDEFVRHGYFNDNHSQATAAVVGIPEFVEYHAGKGWYTEGLILKGLRRADEIWELARSLEGTPRKLGFSIEGKVLERKDNFIVKAVIRNVAVTNSPVNTNCTFSVLSKSFHPELREASKALSAGSARVAPLTTVSGDGAGRSLTPEDLEHDEIKNVFQCMECGKKFGSNEGLIAHAVQHVGGKRGKVRKSVLTEADAVELLQRVRPHYSEALCRRIYEFSLKGV